LSSQNQAPDTSASPDHARWLEKEVQPHEVAVRGYLQHRFPSVDIDDVVQESYLKLLRIHAVSRIASSKAYFFAVARNTARKLFRRRQQLYSDIPVNELPDWRVLDGGPNAADATNSRQRLEIAAAAIDQLPPRCGEIIRLAVVHGLSNAEIARRLSLSEATVRVQMARGIRKCAGFLREKGEVS
jgi:RNA polymerase sigma factor (sigma-70 family)